MNRALAFAGKVASFVLQGTVIAIGFLAVIWVVGSMFEGVVRVKEHEDRCRKDAATPYEYHRC